MVRWPLPMGLSSGPPLLDATCVDEVVFECWYGLGATVGLPARVHTGSKLPVAPSRVVPPCIR